MLFSVADSSHVITRRMTKRPCAVAMTMNDESILVGDKFGDVYCLPLHYEKPGFVSNAAELEEPAPPTAPTPFKPTATTLTVHSARNLKALESQKRQAEAASLKAKDKDAMTFEHELLLGHVSMLTDLIAAADTIPGRSTREYIITADRDEHVRVSRGRPQAHVIEHFCFGHTQFVSKLCLAGADYLVSGGGDDFLLAWDWATGSTWGQLDIRQALNDYFEKHESQSKVPEAVTVAGLWSVQSREVITIYCACEAVAALFEFQIDRASTRRANRQYTKITALSHNVLDVAILGQETESRTTVIVSLDVLRQPNSKDAVAEGPMTPRLTDLSMATILEHNIGREMEAGDVGSTKDLFYGLDKLRKRGTEED